MTLKRVVLIASAAVLPACAPTTARVDPALIRAHQVFLTADALQGRQSATRDEAIAAAYVASRFESYGLTPPPGWTSFFQTGPVPVTKYTKEAGILEDAKFTNAVGFLRGTDPTAGVLLISAHIDHVGVKKGKIYPGASDDASGTSAVLELARLLAKTGPHRRSILFVGYGGEELGGVGSTYFADHPPVPLDDIVANIAFEMIGAADPDLPQASLMMTGFERSDLGDILKANGALVVPDPYPDQKFFERSDNYFLALKGVVAHTISGWAVTPIYHTANDTNQYIDFPFMERAIQSLVAPITRLANSTTRPQWKPGGKPEPKPKK